MRRKEGDNLLGLILLYVGAVLMSNGFYRIQGITDKSNVVMNLFTGGLGLILNIIAIGYGVISNKSYSWFYASATGLLFAFTYLYIAINSIYDLDGRLYGWYCLFVTMTAIPAGILCFYGYGGNKLYGIIWFFWALLWVTGWIETVLGKDLGKKVGYLSVFEGIFTAWIPGLLMLTGLWK